MSRLEAGAVPGTPGPGPAGSPRASPSPTSGPPKRAASPPPHDSTVKRGFKNGSVTREEITGYIKNTYRVLLSRGLKGCYVHFLDEDTRRFVEGRIDDDELPNVVRGPDDPDEGPDTLAAEPRGPYGND